MIRISQKIFRQSSIQIPKNILQKASLRLFSQQTRVSTRSLVVTDAHLKNPWVETKDPKGSQLTYWWNKQTNETTALGSPRPRHWVEVRDPNGSSLTYWWDPETDETTPLGSARPNPFFRPGLSVYQGSLPPQIPVEYVEYRPMTVGQSMAQYFKLGIGLTLGMIFVRLLFGF